MRSMAVVLAAVLVVVGSGFAFGAPPEKKCACHGILMSHPILAGSAIRVTSATVTVETKDGQTTKPLGVDGDLDLGSVSVKDIKKITVTITAVDWDDDVCEVGVEDASAVISANLSVAGSTMKKVVEKTWDVTFNKGDLKVGSYVFAVSGSITDSAVDHPDSKDTDLVISGKYKSHITITN